jgi:hypothetical protein
VFYESHLAQWADEMRPRALLAHEPQSRWPVAADIARPLDAALTPQAGAPASVASQDAAPLLRQQLDVLDTGRFIWRGELWPGQHATVTIEEEDHDDDDHASGTPGAATPAPRWRMRLSLAFPGLGPIDATLALAGDAVDLTMHCQEHGAAARLREAAPALRGAIAERELDRARFTVADDHDR